MTTTAGPVRKPDGTGRIHLRLAEWNGTDSASMSLACGIWGAWNLVPVTGRIRQGERCRRCWPPSEPASGSGAGE